MCIIYGKHFMPIAPVVQLVTSKPSDVVGDAIIAYRRCSHTNWDFMLTSGQTSGERLIRGYTKSDFTVDEGKERPNPSRDKN